MANRKRTASEDLRSALVQLERAHRERSQAFECFAESVKGQEPRARADAWITYVSKNIDGYGDQESLVYLRSRGHDCPEQIDGVVSAWRAAADEKIEECIRGHTIFCAESGRSRRFGRIPRAQANDVKNMSPYLLRNFWGPAHHSQEHTADATMLRTVEWCDIGGFEEWWHRMAQAEKENILQGGFSSVAGAFWLFAMSRSDYAIQLMSDTMRRALEAIEIPLDGHPPWRIFREVYAKAGKSCGMVDNLAYAATLVFANGRLRSTVSEKDLPQQASEQLIKLQKGNGAWPYWAADGEPLSVEATAMCVHALIDAKPRGWERALTKAARWIWSKQQDAGFWSEPSCPDAVYLTVLALDALDLAAGQACVTFGRTFRPPTAAQTTGPRRFRVALSFPGELRSVVKPVADILARRLGQQRVFYDNFFQAELARPNLDTYLQSTYHDQADIIVVFLCADYAKKEWCGLEWRALRDLIKKRRDADIMLLRTDSQQVPGVFSIDGYIDVRNRRPNAIAELIMQRLGTH